MSAGRVAVRAPAKINLSLAVLGRRADGYHELDTVLLALPLADRVVLEERAQGADVLQVTGPASTGVPADASNLAWRAVVAVRELARVHGRRTTAFALELEKHVPAAAGLGGGSADAAAAAFAAAELWGLDPDAPELLQALAALGSDCPFFLATRASGLARCTGRGERVAPLPALALPWFLVLVTPPFGCATARVYAALEPRRPEHRARFEPEQLLGASLEDARGRIVNDLEAAALRSHPELATFRAELEELAPGAFHLAGSGSSYFGFFADARDAEGVSAQLGARSEARRYALRGRWVLPLRSCGLARLDSSSH
ncbi:MAG: 4-(cytidine 5'-diphospho)-2-C-methyl-D-erythritol kinase [Planctomycetes bacterium]|nr:4-(cytidine 5'-diphospho)-2-C-methyl-D-erythritol kinase [Planctomycetota bacterium]